MTEVNKKVAELSYKCSGKKITFSELDQDMDMESFHQHCRELAAAIGYHDNSISTWFDSNEELLNTIDKLNKKVNDLEAVHHGMYT